MENRTCKPGLEIKSLITFMGLVNPYLEGQTDPLDLAELIPQIMDDVTTIRSLTNSISFPSQLKDLLLVGNGLKLIYDKVRGLICTKRDTSPVTEPPVDPTPSSAVSTNISQTMPDLFKFNIADIVLAITSLIIAAITVMNSYCLFHINKGQFFLSHNIETGHLTPILKHTKRPKEVTFSPERHVELHPLQSPTLSLATLPSPQPAHKLNY